MEETHFAQRAREYGITSIDGRTLGLEIKRALDGVGDRIVEFVLEHDGSRFYRFFVAEGVFYCPVVADNWPATVYTQGMMKRQRRKRKAKRGGRLRLQKKP